MKTKKKIIIITTGQPSTNPRSVKEAIALSATCKVTYIYNYWVKWGVLHDEKIIQENPDISWIMVGGDPFKNKWKYYYTRLRHKGFRLLNKIFPNNILIAQHTVIRCYTDLYNAAVRLKADLYIAHNLGALPAAALAAKKHLTKYAFDAEDYHRGQDIVGSAEQKRTILLEDKYLPGAAYITAASPLIAEHYQQLYNRPVSVINNVFSKKHLAKTIKETSKPIKMFWFSQTIGKGRGLEDIILALNEMPADAFSLTLMGKHDEVIKRYFTEVGKNKNQQVEIHFLNPVYLDEIFEIAAQHDIGLALEQPGELNRNLCLTNKIFTYLLAGNAIIFSDTKAQRKFYETHRDIGAIYNHMDVRGLIKILEEYQENTQLLINQKERSRIIANELYNWEAEMDTFKNLIAAC